MNFEQYKKAYANVVQSELPSMKDMRQMILDDFTAREQALRDARRAHRLASVGVCLSVLALAWRVFA